jgi:hypothetical protein
MVRKINTFDHSEQKTHIKGFTSRDRDGVHVSNGLVSLMNLPDCLAFVPDKHLGKFLIKIVMCSSSNEVRILIGLEPSKQYSILDILNHIVELGIGPHCHHMLARKMDRQTIDSRPFHVHGKLKDVGQAWGDEMYLASK